jgi:hypothetical protein
MIGKRSKPPHTTTPPFGSTIGWVDEPRSEGVVAGAPIRIAGWALSIHAVSAVEIRFPDRTFIAHYGSPRPDVAAVRPGYPAGARCGFEFTVDAAAFIAPADVPRSTFRVIVIAGDGSETVIGERSLVDPAARARWSFLANDAATDSGCDRNAGR